MSITPPVTPPRSATLVPAALVGLGAVVFSAVYLLSDLIELAQGGFSTVQLVLTYVGEAVLPLIVLGLSAVQRPRIGRLGLIGAVGYAYCYVFFTGTVIVALAGAVPDFAALDTQLRPWMTVHGVLVLAAGVAFGVAVARAGVLPAWTGWTLAAGVVLVTVAAFLGPVAMTIAAAVRDTAFIGMGVAVLGGRPRR